MLARGQRRFLIHQIASGSILACATGCRLARARALEQALDIYHDGGDRGGEVEALNERGTLYRVSGDLAQAQGCHGEALDLARAIASS